MNPFSSEQPFDPRDQGADPQVVEAKESVQDAWLERPGVHGVGVYRSDDGSDIIEVWVDPGVELGALHLPQDVQGVQVTVRVAAAPVLGSAAPAAEVGARLGKLFDDFARLQMDDNRYDSLTGGISIAARPVVPSRGTLGIVIGDPGSGAGASVLLTNWHVLTAGGSLPGTDPIVQPGTSDQQSDVVGYGVRGRLGNVAIPVNDTTVDVGIDAAVGSTTERASTLHTIHGIIGTVGPDATPQVGMAVAKRGIATGGTCGIVNRVNQAVTVVYNGATHRLDNQFGIQGTVSYPFFSDAGDSGSVILTGTAVGAAAVGLLWGHEPITTPGRLSWACPSQAVAYYLRNS